MRPARNRRTAIACCLTALAAVTLLPPLAEAVGPRGVAYRGTTDQDREIKLVTGTDGAVKRGAFTAMTTCTGQFKPFVADVAFDMPLDRSDRSGFRERGNHLDTDGTYSGRYKYDIDGKRKTASKIKGKVDLEIVFRKNDVKYTTCTVEDLAYKVKRSDQGGAKRA